jgi:hypothetical protein
MGEVQGVGDGPERLNACIAGNALWWLVVWPLLMMPMTAVNLRGELPAYLRDAGFGPVREVGRWFNLLTFWAAFKPGSREGD